MRYVREAEKSLMKAQKLSVITGNVGLSASTKIWDVLHWLFLYFFGELAVVLLPIIHCLIRHADFQHTEQDKSIPLAIY